MKRNSDKLLLVIMIVLVAVFLIGISFAYFFVEVSGNTNAKDVIINTSDLVLNFREGDTIDVSNIFPGESYTKEITIENVGENPVLYSLNWANLTNEFLYGELVMSMTCTSYSNFVSSSDPSNVVSGTCEGLSQTPISTSAGVIKPNINIDVGFTNVYTITIFFIDTSSVQNYNQGARFFGTLRVSE